MSKNFVNSMHVEGYLYSHSLEQKVTGPQSKAPGTTYITGTVEIATDEDCLNIVPIHYSYVTAVTSSGNSNATYSTLSNILDGKFKTVTNSSKEEAAKFRADTAIALNEFYSNRNGEMELVSVKRNEGGFLHQIDKLNDQQRNFFKVDILINQCTYKEPDEEKGIPEKVLVKGAIFDFRKSLLPIELTALDPGAIKYFIDLNASQKEPVFTQVWGSQQSSTIKHKEVKESAWGEDYVVETPVTRKEYVITGANREPYVWDDPSTITANEVKEFMATRETYLATVKQRAIDYQNNKKNAPKATAAANISSGDYNF